MGCSAERRLILWKVQNNNIGDILFFVLFSVVAHLTYVSALFNM